MNSKNITSQQISETSKRSRGRPRKPDPFEWLRHPPPHVSAWANKLEPNINDESHREYRRLCEENRREMVSEGVREAYKAGSNNANLNRQNSKRLHVNRLADENDALIFGSYLSSSSVAEIIAKQGKHIGLAKRTLREYITSIRKVGKAKWRQK